MVNSSTIQWGRKMKQSEINKVIEYLEQDDVEVVSHTRPARTVKITIRVRNIYGYPETRVLDADEVLENMQ